MASVLIGSGPSALAAAAVIEGVTWLDEAAQPLLHPELPVDLGIYEHRDGVRHEELLGDCPAVVLSAQVLAHGLRLELPFKRRDLARLIPLSGIKRVGMEWGRARAQLRAREVVGGGQEQRSYQDWVVYRYGRGLYEQLHAPYALKRFGEPDQVAVALAQLHHGVPSLPWRGFGASPERSARALSESSDRLQGELEGIELQDGRVAAVLSNQGRLPAERLYWSGSLPDLAEWLEGEIPEILATDLSRLAMRHRIEVFLATPEADSLPGVLHVVDSAPFFRVSRADLAFAGAGQQICCHIAVGEGEAEWGIGDSRLIDRCVASVRELGIGTPTSTGAVVRRLPDYDPHWLAGQWFPVHTRVARSLEKMGISLVGRAGAYRWMDRGQELELSAAIARSPEQWHEHLRTLVDPPIALQDEGISVTRFVER